MANSSKFDRQEVVNKATNLYWEQGFHATSMRQLQTAIDMRPGSIYAAFGSKEGLFLESIQHYTSMGLEKLAQCRALHSSALTALKDFVQFTVINSQTDAPSGMCMLAKTIAELNQEQQQLLNATQDAFKTMEQAFTELLIEAQQQGDIAADKDPQQLARHLQVQIAGLRTYAKANGQQAPLQSMLDDLFLHHPF